MNEISNGLVTLVNGAIAGGHWVIQPWIALSVIIGLSLAWMAILEIEHMDRVSSAKPVVERH